MSGRKLLALGGLAGVAYVVLEMAGVIVGSVSQPYPYDIFPSADTAARLAATTTPAGVWIGFGLEVFSTMLFVAFIVCAVAAIRDPKRSDFLPNAALVGGIVNVTLIFSSFGIMAARNMGAGHGLDAQSEILLANLMTGSYFMSWPSSAILVGCIGAAAIRTGTLPAWLGWAGIAVAVIGLVGCLDPIGLGQLAQLPQLLLWIPAAGIGLLIKGIRGGTTQQSTVMMPA